MTKPKEIHEVPGNRPCQACSRPMSENALFWFGEPGSGDIRCICTSCRGSLQGGFTFDPWGNAIWETSQQQVDRVVQETKRDRRAARAQKAGITA